MCSRFFALLLFVCSASAVGDAPEQAILGHRSAPLLTEEGLTFKDLNRNGKLDPYEDWRLPANVRAADLVQRMSVEELAGLMVHGTLPSSGPLAPLGVGKEYDLVKVRQFIEEDHVNSFTTRLNGRAEFLAEQNNEVQAIAEASRLGVPVTISSDPRHHFEQVLGATMQDRAFSMWPESLGFAAANDPELTRRFGDVVRQEYECSRHSRIARAAGRFGDRTAMGARQRNFW